MDAFLGSMRWAAALLVAGCAASSVGTGDDAGSSIGDAASDGAPSRDATTIDGVAPGADAADAGALFAACNPNGGASACPDGLLCFGFHTDPTWGCNASTGCIHDLYGHCYVTCGEGDQGIASCTALGGSCGCPILQGTDAGWDCLPDGSYVCTPRKF